MSGVQENDDLVLLDLIKQDNGLAYQKIYDRYWEKVFAYAFNQLHHRESAEEIVQEVFLMLWEKRNSITINTSFEGYLLGATKHKVLNLFRSIQVREQYAAEFSRFARHRFDNSNEELQNLHDLEQSIEHGLAELPERCRMVYQLSRQFHVPNNRIAKRMNISVKTVENYLTYALKHLRSNVGEISVVFFCIGCSIYLGSLLHILGVNHQF